MQFYKTTYGFDKMHDALVCSVAVKDFKLHLVLNDFAKIADEIEANLPTTVYVYNANDNDSISLKTTLNRKDGKWTLETIGSFSNLDVDDRFEDAELFRAIDKKFKEYKSENNKGIRMLFGKYYDLDELNIDDVYTYAIRV